MNSGSHSAVCPRFDILSGIIITMNRNMSDDGGVGMVLQLGSYQFESFTNLNAAK